MTYLSHGRGVRLADGERGSSSTGPFDEEDHRVILRERRNIEAVLNPRARHRWHAPRDLARNAQWFSTCGQHRCGRILGEQVSNQRGATFNEMFAVVEDKERRLLAEFDRELVARRRAGHLAGAQSSKGRPPDRIAIGEGGQLHPPHPSRISLERLRGHGERQPRLPYSGRTGERDESIAGHERAQVGDLARPPDEWCELNGKVVSKHFE